ncbi:hypothetical protein ACFXTO_023367 [Malus domestica]
MGSEGSHSTQNDTPFAPSAKQRKKEGKRVALQAKVDELEAQNNKIAMKNEVLQEQSELIIKTLINVRLLSTQLFRPEAGEVEEDTSLQKGWKDKKPFIVTAETF